MEGGEWKVEKVGVGVGGWGICGQGRLLRMAPANVLSGSDRRGISSQNPGSRFKSQFCPAAVLHDLTL